MKNCGARLDVKLYCKREVSVEELIGYVLLLVTLPSNVNFH